MRTSLLVTFIVMHAIAACAHAVEPVIEWEKTFGGNYWDRDYWATQTSDGGYVVAASTRLYGAGRDDVYLIKTDSTGNMQWQQTFGGGSFDLGHSVQQTSDGGYIIAGDTVSYGAGGWDIYLVKTDSVGEMQWQETFGSWLDDIGLGSAEFGNSVQQTTDGGYVVAGSTQAVGEFPRGNFFLVKTNPAGNMLWRKTFGGSGNDRAYSVQQTSDGGYVVAGYTESYGAGSYDVYLIKTDSAGNMQWQKTFGESGDDRAYSVQQTSDGGYVVAGSINMGTTNSDVYLIKTDSIGNIQWQKTLGGVGGRSVQQTSDGGYVIVGTTWSLGTANDVYLIKTDSAGNLLWEKTIGGSDAERGNSVQQTTDGGYVIGGSIYSYATGSVEVYLIKLGPEEPPGPPPEPWTFVHMTDTHIGSDADCEDDEALVRLASTIQQINDMEGPTPKFVLIGGDVVENAYHAGISGNLCTGYYTRFLRALDSFEIDVYTVPGNHDRYNQTLVDSVDLNCYNQFINPNRPDGTIDLLSPNNYLFKKEGIQFIGMDSGAGWPRGDGLIEPQWTALHNWELVEQVTPKVIFMHHPPIDVGLTDETFENYTDDFIDYCRTYNVKLVLAGHTHEDHVFDRNVDPEDPLPVSLPVPAANYPIFVQTPSTGKDDGDSPAYRIIDVIDNLPRPRAIENIQELDNVTDDLCSSANLHVYDSYGGHVGMLESGEAELGIPNSFYFSYCTNCAATGDESIVGTLPEKVIIFHPSDDYLHEVVGTEEGTYGLNIR